MNQLQMALFAWIKRNPAGDRPLGGLLVMDEAQNFAPSGRTTVATRSTLALSSQARKYGLGLVFATQAPRGLHPNIPGNAATQFFGLLNAPVQIAVAKEMARVKGGLVPDISRLRAGNFYAALEGTRVPQDHRAVVSVVSPAQPAHHRGGARAVAAPVGAQELTSSVGLTYAMQPRLRARGPHSARGRSVVDPEVADQADQVAVGVGDGGQLDALVHVLDRTRRQTRARAASSRAPRDRPRRS